MINTLYLPELREMLAEENAAELAEFCTALHPARTAEFMEGLDPEEIWAVLRHAPPSVREEVFNYLPHDVQVAIIESQDRREIAELVTELAADDRVDLLRDVRPKVVAELMPLVPTEERREVLRLRAYPEGVAGAAMTTEMAKLDENLTVRQALTELSRQAENLETIYYLYIVDDSDHLRGLVSARELVSAMGKPDVRLGDLMESDIITSHVLDDLQDVWQKVARYDLLAIPVVDEERRLLGIITHDDVIDMVREEATEDAHRIAGIEPLEESYLRTGLITLGWKRSVWLAILFFTALSTALALQYYEQQLAQWHWLAWFIPLVISCGGNSGSQSATLVITALATGDVQLSDWWRIVQRELPIGVMLGVFLGAIGLLASLPLTPSASDALVIPVTILLIVMCSTLVGSLLPLLFVRLGLDPALMSNPFVTGIMDILGIVIYMNVAFAFLASG